MKNAWKITGSVRHRAARWRSEVELAQCLGERLPDRPLGERKRIEEVRQTHVGAAIAHIADPVAPALIGAIVSAAIAAVMLVREMRSRRRTVPESLSTTGLGRSLRRPVSPIVFGQASRCRPKQQLVRFSVRARASFSRKRCCPRRRSRASPVPNDRSLARPAAPPAPTAGGHALLLSSLYPTSQTSLFARKTLPLGRSSMTFLPVFREAQASNLRITRIGNVVVCLT